MGNIIGQPLDGYVAEQINARQILHGSGVRSNDNERNPDQINILNSNTAWIKLASGVSIDPNGPGMQKLKDLGFTETERSNLSGMGLAKKYVLYAGTSQYNNGTLSQREGFRPPTFESVYKDSELKGAIARDSEDSSYIYSRNLNSQGLHESDSGYAPMPGIISAEIKALNRGSLEKAFIKIKAQNRQQLDILDLLYMRLGYTVLLEWGNSLYTDDGINKKVVRNTIIEDKFFQYEGKRSYLDFIGGTNNTLIKSYKQKYSGNCDGMLAIISNFSWTFNPDGSYDIDLTLISLGDVIESLKTNLSISQGLTQYIATYNVPEDDPQNPAGDIIEDNKKSNVISSMLWLFKRFGPTSKKLTIVSEGTTTVDVGNFLANGDATLTTYTKVYHFRRRDYLNSDGNWVWQEFDKTFTGENPEDDADKLLIDQYLLVFPNARGFVSTDDINKVGKKASLGPASYVAEYTETNSSTNTISNPIDTAPFKTAFIFNSKTPQYFLRFQYLLEYIQEKVIPLIKSDNGDAPLFSIDTGLWSNKMYSLPNQISLDPKVCLVRNENFLKKSGKYDKVLKELPYFRVADKGANENPNFAYLMNIYLNFEFIINSLDSNINDRGDVNIYGFISTLCTGLNKALGGINNLEPVLDKDEVTLKIIDSTPIPGVTSPNTGDYELMLYGYEGSNFQRNLQSFSDYDSTFVRNIDLKTSITPEYATMVTVGATANGYVKGTEATAFSIWNRGLTDRFKQELISPDPDYNASTNPNEAVYNYTWQFLAKYAQCYGLNNSKTGFLGGVLGDFTKDVISKNLAVVTEYYKYLLTERGKTSQQAGTIGFIPFKLGITMDGISGIKIYNKLKVNSKFLPSRYGDTLDFIITGVNHRLQNNDWETTLDTIVIPKTSEIKALDISSIPIIPTTIPTGNKATGDLYIWVKGQLSTEPGFPNGYLANVLSKTIVSGSPISKPYTPLTILTSGFQTRPRSSVRVFVTKYKSVDASPAENEQFFKDILTKIGARPTSGNLIWMKGWRQIEDGNALYNPFNTTQVANRTPSNYNTFKVQNYFTRTNGINFTYQTMTNGKYPNIIKALKKGIPNKTEGEKLARLLQERNPKQSDIDTLINSW
jgi:hypothetical protein